MDDNEKTYWLDKPGSSDKVYWLIWAICAVLAAADFMFEKHTTFAMEHVPVIYGLYGFVCFFGIVLAGKELRKWVMRDEDYYDR